ncbi:MAG: hypothetical protein GC191_00615 [Azospirillum sp.]|nr:hypothetical protein [Azospirillum sp.]
MSDFDFNARGGYFGDFSGTGPAGVLDFTGTRDTGNPHDPTDANTNLTITGPNGGAVTGALHSTVGASGAQGSADFSGANGSLSGSGSLDFATGATETSWTLTGPNGGSVDGTGSATADLDAGTVDGTASWETSGGGSGSVGYGLDTTAQTFSLTGPLGNSHSFDYSGLADQVDSQYGG